MLDVAGGLVAVGGMIFSHRCHVDASLELGIGCAPVAIVRNEEIQVECHEHHGCHDKNLLHFLLALFQTNP